MENFILPCMPIFGCVMVCVYIYIYMPHVHIQLRVYGRFYGLNLKRNAAVLEIPRKLAPVNRIKLRISHVR